MTLKDKKTSIDLPILGESPVDPTPAVAPTQVIGSDQPSEKQYWRSLAELSGDPRATDLAKHEFPEGADQLLDPVSRRGFMKVMGASFALAGLSACVSQPEEKIIPYVKQPEELVPGKPLFYATTATLGGFAKAILVESHEGRPTRVAGNPEHPASLGGVDVHAQAEILQLYDPDRSQRIVHKGENSSWDSFVSDVSGNVTGSSGIALLLGTIGSPSLRSAIAQFSAANPDARIFHYEPTPLTVGSEVVQLDLSRANVIVSLDSDLLSSTPDAISNAKAFGARRDPEQNNKEHNRLYVAEPSPSATGSIADHRLAARSTDIYQIAAAIANGLGVGGSAPRGLSEHATAWISAVVDDLKKNSGSSVVAAGISQGKAVHTLVRAINEAIGAVGSTVAYSNSPAPGPDNPLEGIENFVDAATKGEISTVIIAGSNPMYDAPGDLDIKAAMEAIPLRIHHGLYYDETAFWSHWHIPSTHQFETWGDGVSYDGTESISQPLIAPLYQSTRSLAQIIALLNGDGSAKDHDLIKAYWEPLLDGEKGWRKALHDGFISGGSPASVAVADVPATGDAPSPSPAATPPADAGGLEVNFRPDPNILDGRYNNNGWLQELPKPITKLVWDNAVLVSPKLASDNNLENGDVVELTLDDRTISGPVWITPGQADGSITVHFGYGRERTGRVGDGAGFNAFPLRSTAAAWFATGVTITGTGDDHLLVSTQDHWSLEGRNLYRQVTLEDFLANDEIIHDMEHIHEEGLSFYSSANWKHDGYAWGMTIDLNRCTSCNACVIACQSENNIPVIGKDEVSVGREMHWIRVDRYFGGDPMDTDSVEVFHQPVPCMQCELAPCEVVCPVAATVHSAEGLNDMVYNRCVGTRYCSNNCPYKVRRFNFLQYVDEDTEQYRLMRNPDVSVRTRGVMEKCTYCVQRINEARISAKIDNTTIATNGVVTACQSACPTDAIAFGDINNPESEVARLKSSPRNYGMLMELNTRPRTTYLARLRNTHESLKPAEKSGDDHH